MLTSLKTAIPYFQISVAMLKANFNISILKL